MLNSNPSIMIILKKGTKILAINTIIAIGVLPELIKERTPEKIVSSLRWPFK